MRKLLATLLAFTTLSATAQQPAQQPVPPPLAGSNWQRVQALAAGTSINVKARASHASCKLKSVDADTLTCTHGKDLVFQRTDIVNIKVPHRGRSTLIGLAIGGGTGALIGVATGSSSCAGQNFCINIFSRADLAAVGGVSLGAVGALVGGLTDFSRSTVYRAP
jgi:hypothetical protein